jgi:hypothetical protein
MVSAQTTKTRLNEQQIWLGYFNQTRVTNKFGFWGDFHIRTKENFVDNFYQSIVRPGITYFITDSTRLTVGYAYVENYPAEGHASVTQPEHRFWQQVQWRTNYGKTRMMQWIRLEEKYKHKVLNDSTLGDGYNFNYKIRYNFSYEIPFSQKRTNKVSFQINDEIHINFGKQIVYNYFDQNRFFVGLKLIFTQNSYIQCGYMNQFQQLASGNRYRNNNAIRLFYYQNLDLRHKKG